MDMVDLYKVYGAPMHDVIEFWNMLILCGDGIW